jgi:hypothetical protein
METHFPTLHGNRYLHEQYFRERKRDNYLKEIYDGVLCQPQPNDMNRLQT